MEADKILMPELMEEKNQPREDRALNLQEPQGVESWMNMTTVWVWAILTTVSTTQAEESGFKLLMSFLPNSNIDIFTKLSKYDFN